jgi:hypothetical protein
MSTSWLAIKNIMRAEMSKLGRNAGDRKQMTTFFRKAKSTESYEEAIFGAAAREE